MASTATDAPLPSLSSLPALPCTQLLEVRSAGPRGRGVFAREHITAGTVFERAPVLVLPCEEWPELGRTLLRHYMFHWGSEDYLQAAVGLGFASMYNHSFTCNAKYERNYDLTTLDFVAVRDIEVGEEVLINYNGRPDNMEPMYFDVV
eukprot:TRINITY_DN9518_c0_g1_i3.p1 TRINITY_DN9518_c0_g1~~TRINITY_DN9518_c0_g1_i3.p1  ORF type:complete len:148 (+),score=26.75 TRINITY_DN9518_c0_g1_i3:32-475(+)